MIAKAMSDFEELVKLATIVFFVANDSQFVHSVVTDLSPTPSQNSGQHVVILSTKPSVQCSEPIPYSTTVLGAIYLIFFSLFFCWNTHDQ